MTLQKYVNAELDKTDMLMTYIYIYIYVYIYIYIYICVCVCVCVFVCVCVCVCLPQHISRRGMYTYFLPFMLNNKYLISNKSDQH